jgi:uncharacterized membrane protein
MPPSARPDPSPTPLGRRLPPWLGIPRGLILWLALFVVTVYPPLAVLIYTTPAYEFNCQWHDRCEQLEIMPFDQAVTNLAAFMRHEDTLQGGWSDKEQAHLAEVRTIFDGLLVAFLVALALVIALGRRPILRRASLANLAVVLATLAVLPFFKYFWAEIFHPLLFDNDLWRNNRGDVSWYLMPRVYFRHALIGIVTGAVLLNVALWIGLRPRRRGSPEPTRLPGDDES